jgi:hypothetical protein
VQPLFERGRLDAAVAEADAEMLAMAAIADATTASATSGPLATLGLLGEEPMADLEAARIAFEDGQLDAAVMAADASRATWLQAEDVGRSRLAGTALVIGAVGLLVLVLRARRSRPGARVRPPVDQMAGR